MNSLAPCRANAAVVALALLSGCVSTGVYPDHWAEKVDAERGACPDIDGEYLNKGEYFEKVGDGGIVRHTASLGALACATCTEDERSAPGTLTSLTEVYERFRLELVDESLIISATTADGITYRHEQPIHARCSGSLLQFEAGWWSSLEEEDGWEVFGTTLGMSMLARASTKLGRAQDGSLLIRQSMVASVMVLQWPVFPMVEAGWIRFPAATPRTEPREPPLPQAAQPQLQAGMPP